MNRYVTAIECRSQTIRQHRGNAIPILSRIDARRPHERPNDTPNENNDTPNFPRNDLAIIELTTPRSTNRTRYEWPERLRFPRCPK